MNMAGGMMLNLGDPLLTQEDINVLKGITKFSFKKLDRPITGIEVGPWLGRSTLALLAPDLPIADPNPLESYIRKLTQKDFSTVNEIQEAVSKYIFQCFSGASLDLLCLWLSNLLSYKVEPKGKYFEKLWIVDTWEGISSELNLFFKEASDKRALACIIHKFSV